MSHQAGYVVIRIREKKQVDRNPFFEVSDSTTFIHIDGYPFDWALRQILGKAPNVRTIRVVPTNERRIGKGLLALCAKRDIRIVTGHHRPDLIWRNSHQARSPHYESERKFFLSLDGERKEQFDELLELGLHGVKMAERYFCLNDEEPIGQYAIAQQFGLESNHSVSLWVNAVIRYLDPSFETGKRSRRMAQTMKERVRIARKKARKAREEARKAQALQSRLDKIGLKVLPKGFPMSRFHILELLMNAYRDGRLEELKDQEPQWAEILVLRYGIEDDVFRTLEAVGELFDLTRARIQQVEEDALEFLETAEAIAN